MVSMKKPLGVMPPCGATLPRRAVLRRVGGWVIFGGTVTVSACGRTPLGDPLDGFIPGDDDDDGFTPTPTPTLTPTPTPEACTCDPVAGSPTGLFVSDLSVGTFAASAALNTFICRDASGFYAMADNCVHQSSWHIITDGGTYNPANLAAGFTCGQHGSDYGANGNVTGGPAPAGGFLIHYLLTIHPTTNELHLEKARIVDPTCRCSP